MADTPLPRDQFPVVENHVYVNHAGVGPLPRAAAEVGRAFLDDFLDHGAVHYQDWEAVMEATRGSTATLMGVDAADVAFVKNTTEGLGFVANGLTWRPGDRIVVPDREFPSTLYPFLGLRDLGVSVDLLEPVGDGWTLPLERFEDALRAAPTRLVVVSWVQFARGWRTDLAALAELCHEHGALLCADVIQGLGVIPAHLARWGVDFATADAHKWLLGPAGCGVLYVAGHRRDLLRVLEPGWASVAHREEWENLDLVLDDSARRFEGGTQSLELIAQLGASVDLLLAAGVGTVWSHVQLLGDHLAVALAEVGATVLSDRSVGGRSGHVTFTVPGVDPDEAWERLEAQAIVCAARGGGVRIAPHGYNTVEEIDRIVDAVRSLVR